MNNSFPSLTAMRSGLSEADLRLIAGCGHQVATVEGGREICSSPMMLHVLLDGWACKYRLLANGRRQVIAVHLPGDLCDVNKLAFPDFDFGVQAVTVCRVVAVSITALRAAVDEKPALRDLLWSLTVLDNIVISELVMSVGSRSARERMAWFFCDLLERLQLRGKVFEGSFRLELTQSDMADALGLSLVHINRTLQTLKADGVIRSRGSTFMILEPERLRTIAGYADSMRLANDVPSGGRGLGNSVVLSGLGRGHV